MDETETIRAQALDDLDSIRQWIVRAVRFLRDLRDSDFGVDDPNEETRLTDEVEELLDAAGDAT